MEKATRRARVLAAAFLALAAATSQGGVDPAEIAKADAVATNAAATPARKLAALRNLASACSQARDAEAMEAATRRILGLDVEAAAKGRACNDVGALYNHVLRRRSDAAAWYHRANGYFREAAGAAEGIDRARALEPVRANFRQQTREAAEAEARRTGSYDRLIEEIDGCEDADRLEALKEALTAFEGYKDCSDRMARCGEKIAALHEQERLRREEEERLRREAEERRLAEIEEEKRRREEEKERQKAERERLKAERAARRRSAGEAVAAVEAPRSKKTVIAVIVALLLIGCTVFVWWLPVIRQEKAYQQASAALEAGDYAAAIEGFSALGYYKDSEKKLWKASKLFDEANSVPPPSDNVGETIVFGAYEQDNDTSNGAEPIEWSVLAKEDDRILVISQYALDCQPYNKKNESVIWETCSLRSWLNDIFLELKGSYRGDKEELKGRMITFRS